MEKILHPKGIKGNTIISEKLNFTENENMACKYYSNEPFKKIKKDNQDKNISLIHLNIFSLPYHTDNLTNLLYDLDFKFKVIAITKSRLTTKKDQKKLLKYQITLYRTP